MASSKGWVVDLDIEKFFDRVNHDVLMSRLAKRIGDKRILKLIRCYLEAGVMSNGVVIERVEGTPQGGPLSPLLANILLDEFDKEVERRGHAFCRYAADSGALSGSSGKRMPIGSTTCERLDWGRGWRGGWSPANTGPGMSRGLLP